jgi:hypothetical protein
MENEEKESEQRRQTCQIDQLGPTAAYQSLNDKEIRFSFF